MASYLRPRRGKKATALSQNITLKAGEVFFETPTTGVGTGAGRIMMGNGSNNYTYLNNNKKAFITDINCPDCYISNFTATAGNTTLSNNDTYLNNMKPGASASTFFTNLWTLLSSHNKQLTQLNNDLISLNSKIVRIETKSFGSRGTGNWHQYSFIYSKPFTIVPLVSIIPTSPFATENIHLLGYDLNGVTFRVYESSTSFDYSVRVFVIGY